MPARCTAAGSRYAIADDILLVHHSHSLKTLVGNDVVAEHVGIFLEHRLEISAERLHVLHEIGVDIILQTADAVVVLYQPASGGFFHYVEHMFAVAHRVKESGERTEVLCTAARIEQMRIDTLQLVHNGTDILDAVGQLYAHGLLYHADKRVAGHHGRKIVHTVGQGQRLRVGIILAHLLYTTVNIAQMRINFLNDLAFEHRLKPQYTVGRRVLRTDIHHEIAVREQFVLLGNQFSVGCERILHTVIRFLVVFQRISLYGFIILAQRISLEIAPQI